VRELLRALPEGVPLDCLLSRIKGRRSFLVEDWERELLVSDCPTPLPQAPWRQGLLRWEAAAFRYASQRECAWCFTRMAEPLRLALLPFFWLAEVRTLAICLRNRAGGRECDEQLLAGSLLADRVKRVFRGNSNAMETLTSLTALLAPHDEAFARLPEIYRESGAGALEAAMTGISLEHFAAAHPHPVMGRYLALMIDGRNLVAIAKHLRWRIVSPPHFLRGGSIATASLVKLFDRKDERTVARMAATLAPRSGERVDDEVERAVLCAQGKALRSMAREPEGIGAILDYLWRCGMEARNLSLLARMAQAGSDEVGREICQ
jgi:hypothetical protein